MRRAVETLADMSEYSEVEAQALAAAALEAGEEAKPPPPKQAPAALIAAVEKLAPRTATTSPTSSLCSDRSTPTRQGRCRDGGYAPEIFSAALDRLTASIPPKPLTAPEIIVALHDVDPARDGVPLKRSSAAAARQRPDVFPAGTREGVQKVVEFAAALLMRTVLSGDGGAQRARVHARLWGRREAAGVEDGPKIWRDSRDAPSVRRRSFSLLCELPPSALGEMLGKFPAMQAPLLAYASAPLCSRGYRGDHGGSAGG